MVRGAQSRLTYSSCACREGIVKLSRYTLSRYTASSARRRSRRCIGTWCKEARSRKRHGSQALIGALLRAASRGWQNETPKLKADRFVLPLRRVFCFSAGKIYTSAHTQLLVTFQTETLPKSSGPARITVCLRSGCPHSSTPSSASIQPLTCSLWLLRFGG
jgi:hypothetical protein